MGIIVSITLASTANIHFELNKIEAGRNIFPKTRTNLKKSAISLLLALIFCIGVSLLKGSAGFADTGQAIVNSLILLTLLFSLFVLWDIANLVFKIRGTSKVQKDGE